MARRWLRWTRVSFETVSYTHLDVYKRQDYPWTRPGLSMPDRLMTMMDCLMDVDTVKGTVTYRYDVGKYPGKWQPYRPVTSLRFSVTGTAEIYNLGLKELVWASAHRRFPTGVRFHQPGLDKGLYAADNLYQLEAPPMSKRYGWEYAAGRLPALVDTVEVTATQAVVQILPHNFVLEEDEEHHLPRRKIKMRLMRQLTQSNLKLNNSLSRSAPRASSFGFISTSCVLHCVRDTIGIRYHRRSTTAMTNYSGPPTKIMMSMRLRPDLHAAVKACLLYTSRCV